MKDQQEREETLVDLGCASSETHGAEGEMIDWVRFMERTGISQD
jgi:hypothetical protein